ncbi:MAG: hypothetical protein EP343_00710 [Deltaproteobacteria bacterium]|nr:MAG: hypothetical protein EP343_00710 [Deltaproteobacteria bacterium]
METEYAIRFTPDESSSRPGNAIIFRAISHAISQIVKTQDGERFNTHYQFFTQNGGAFYYEFYPIAFQGGLVEGATPECRTPIQLLLYQKAQEELLQRAVPKAESILNDFGFSGELGLLKNCKDFEGHVYGAQENYEVRIAQGWRLGLYRLGLLCLLPLSLTISLLWWLLLLVILVAFALLLIPIFVLGVFTFVYRWIKEQTKPKDERQSFREILADVFFPEEDDQDEDLEEDEGYDEYEDKYDSASPQEESSSVHSMSAPTPYAQELRRAANDDGAVASTNEPRPLSDEEEHAEALRRVKRLEAKYKAILEWDDERESRHVQAEAILADPNDSLEQSMLMKWLHYAGIAMAIPTSLFLSLLLWLCGFWELRQGAMAFLISRPLLSGAGTLEEDGRFVLSEKAASIKHLLWISLASHRRGFFDFGNLSKAADLTVFEFRTFFRLFRPKQRLQLGLSDSNMLQTAEYLKLGLTDLVMDMAEAGFLKDAPQPKRPLQALQQLVGDPSLQTKVPCRDGLDRSMVELQRYYCEKAKAFLEQSASVPMEVNELVALWSEVLDSIETEPTRWVGRLDWVTKRYVLETAGEGAEASVLKTLDLRYHELKDGYAMRWEEEGLAPVLFSPEEIEHAVFHPPPDTPAFARGRLVQAYQYEELPVSISWQAVRVGGKLRGKVIALEDFRNLERSLPSPSEED